MCWEQISEMFPCSIDSGQFIALKCYDTVMWTNATVQRHDPRKLFHRVCWQCYNSHEKSSFLLALQPLCSSKGPERISIESSLYTSWKTISENPVYQQIKVWYSDVLSSAYPAPVGRMLENSDPTNSTSGICQALIQAMYLRWQFGFRYQTSSSRCWTEGIQSSCKPFSKFWVQIQNFSKFWSSPM